MRLLKRQKGLPFLLALGVLFILSASFLAVQLWSDKYTMRGAVQALEAPVMPPAVPKIVAPPPVKKVVRTQPVKPDVQPAEIKAEPEVAAADSTPADINAAEVKIVTETPVEKAPEKKVIPAPAVEPVKAVVIPVEKTEKKEEKKVDVSKKAEPVAHMEKKEEKQPKAVKKARKAKKNVEAVPTEIPAEWNWFSQPLKLSFNDGKAVIDRSENDKSISLSPEEKIRVESASVADAAASEEEKQPSDAAVSEADPSAEKPFMLALARMARIRQMRLQNTGSGEKKAVATKTVELSPSMKAMGSMLRELCEKLDRRPEVAENSLSPNEKAVDAELVVEKHSEPMESSSQDAVESSEVIAEEASSEASEKVETTGDTSFKPYYSGSGSSFSARINSMLKHGLIRAE